MDFYENFDKLELHLYESAQTIICKKCRKYMKGEIKQNGIKWRCECGNSFFEEVKKD